MFFDCEEEKIDLELELGVFVGEVKSMLNDELLKSNVKSISKGTIFKIAKDDLLKFLGKHPGLKLFM